MKITLQVEGMACPRCEAHMNEAVKKAFPQITSVTSSHENGETVIVTDTPISDGAIKKALAQTGYQIGRITRDGEKKKGLFGYLR